MICRIEALHFRCLRYVNQPVEPFQILIGPNASGKTTFLDVVAFLGQLVSHGLDAAVLERTPNMQDLIWQRTGNQFELAIEARIPEERRSMLSHPNFDTVRYEVAIVNDIGKNEIAILEENVLLKKVDEKHVQQRKVFPESLSPPETILHHKSDNTKIILSKERDGSDHFYSEVTSESDNGWFPPFKFGLQKSVLASLPPDETNFPVSVWLKELLTKGVQHLLLNSQTIQSTSRPGLGAGLQPDGSNLPWLIAELQQKDPSRFQSWINHLQTALEDLEHIRVIELPDNRHRYIMLCYQGGLEIPSWVASDGTLRLLALTLPAYMPNFTGVYLVEEPENGIHPQAIETMFQSLSSVYDGQILLATHSPVILSVADLDHILCFKKTPEGATDIVAGKGHPALQGWRGETNLSVFFAAGVLG